MTWYHGYIALLFALGLPIGLSRVLSRWRDSWLTRQLISIVLYFGLATVCILHVDKVYYLFSQSHGYSNLFQLSFQNAMGIEAASILAQVLLVLRVRPLFMKAIVAAAVSFTGQSLILAVNMFGMVYVVWFLIFSGCVAGLIMVSTLFDDLLGTVARANESSDFDVRKEILAFVRAELDRLLRVGAQTFLALGASVGVSMSILFRGGEPTWRNEVYLTRAATMIVGFGAVGLALAIWLFRPYLGSFARIRGSYESAAMKRDRTGETGEQEV